MKSFLNHDIPARQQRYSSFSGTSGVILTHESVDAEYIAIWLAARLEAERNGPYPERGRIESLTKMLGYIECMGEKKYEVADGEHICQF